MPWSFSKELLPALLTDNAWPVPASSPRSWHVKKITFDPLSVNGGRDSCLEKILLDFDLTTVGGAEWGFWFVRRSRPDYQLFHYVHLWGVFRTGGGLSSVVIRFETAAIGDVTNKVHRLGA